MRSAKPIAATVLLSIGTALCMANTWYCAVRSTIPISLSGKVADKRLRTEHTPGVDDVCFLIFEDGRAFHVDKPVFDALVVGDQIEKSAWSFELAHGGLVERLEWSTDAKRMIWVMLIHFAILVVLAVFVIKSAGELRQRRSRKAIEKGII